MRIQPKLEPGRSYRLIRPFEVRDEVTGTIRSILRAHTLVKIKRLDPDADRVWIDAVNLPLPLSALPRHLTPAG